VGRTVPDLGAARGFLIHDRGFTQGREKPDHPAEFVSHGEVMFTLWRAEDPASAIAFDRRHGICLHHLALQVASASALDAPHDDLARREDVQVELAPESPGGGSTRHMMCSIPGSIRLGLVAPERR
jgi:4-hydroxyphenylpyruvate dioxygenase-like putative hemolysin